MGDVSDLRPHLALVLLLAGCSSAVPPGEEASESLFENLQETVRRATTVTLDFRHSEEGRENLVYESGTLRMKFGNKLSVTFRNDSKEEVFRFRSDGEKMGRFRPGASSVNRLDAPGDLESLLKRAMFRWCYLNEETLESLGKEGGIFRLSRSITGFKRETLAADLETLSYKVYTGVIGAPPIDVRLWYVPFDYRLLKVRMVLSFRGMQWVVMLDNIELNEEIPASEFEVPPALTAKASADLAMLRSALERYAIDNNSYPTTEQGLEALLKEPEPRPKKWKGPYLEGAGLKDPWGRPWLYRSPRAGINPEGYDLSSGGPDGKAGTRDDIIR
jgi:type II secretion system protein G